MQGTLATREYVRLVQSWLRLVESLAPPAQAPIQSNTLLPQELHINFLEKGAVLASEPGGQEEDGFDPSELTSRRRLLRSAVEKWLRPRAPAVKKLVLMSVAPTACCMLQMQFLLHDFLLICAV